MFGNLISKYKVSKRLKDWGNLGINALVAKYMNGKTCLKDISEVNKLKIAEELNTRLMNIMAADNQFLSLRNEISVAACYYASLQVLSLREYEKMILCSTSRKFPASFTEEFVMHIC